MTENPEIGVFVHIPNPAGFFVQPDRGGGAVVSVPVSHARIHVFVVRQKLTVSRRPFSVTPSDQQHPRNRPIIQKASRG
ncbi:hypothetical protein [Sphingobium baderi]|uniref:Uncharacterized protein n=1 Tax=Sphingobium baderi LL03 TaxID=1114964 RepID=T0GYF3_9SPHN|nr:hypothetical protein [Sphingobium baderi]EQB05717.1 hypothetical protein L485_02065 [Sphingobium baderi LL03]KMS50636.1 hypothetical protein V475_23055 [Sphingobium baderi LL03]